MEILEKILGKEKTETKKESKKASDDANREKMRTQTPAKTSLFFFNLSLFFSCPLLGSKSVS